MKYTINFKIFLLLVIFLYLFSCSNLEKEKKNRDRDCIKLLGLSLLCTYEDCPSQNQLSYQASVNCQTF